MIEQCPDHDEVHVIMERTRCMLISLSVSSFSFYKKIKKNERI